MFINFNCELYGKEVMYDHKQKNINVTGKVTDLLGEALIGVNIREVGTTNGTITDIEGNYSIKVVSKNSLLSFSYIGYKSQELVVKNRTVIDVLLEEETSFLDEVVVVGYGTMRQRDLTGAISTIKTESLVAENPRSVQDLLRANSAGLAIDFSANAKASAGLQVRGKNTLKAGSSPLFVVDGVIYEGDLSDINPMDIASIDVLKDASSSAVYGAKAANGVVVIMTHQGGSRGKPTISFNTNIGFVKSANQRKILSPSQHIEFRELYEKGRMGKEYLAKYPEMFQDPRSLEIVSQYDWYNYDKETPVNFNSEEDLIRSWLARLDFKVNEIENYLSGRTTNWADEVFHKGFQQDYTVSISNKKDDVSYYMSLGYTDREGIIVGDRFKALRGRLNLESKITNFLSIGTNLNFSTRDEKYMQCDWEQLVRLTPFALDEIGNEDIDVYNWKYPTGDVSSVNPFFDNMYRDRKKRFYTFNGNVFAKVSLPFGIEYELNYIPYLQWYNYYNHDSSENFDWAQTGGRAVRENSFRYNWQIDNILRWKKRFNSVHNFEITLLANAEKGQYWSDKMSTSNFSPSDILGYHRMQAGTVPLNESNDTYRTGDALMARLYYSYADKYMITTSVRRDGYSAFGQKNPRATFPAVALGWVFTSENFLEPINNWFNYGKLRFSWGENGNRDIGQYEALSDLVSGLHPYIDPSGNLYLSSQLYVNRMANRELKWERTASYNFGLDFALFNGALGGSIDAYIATTNDLLVDRALPDILGFSSVVANLGKLRNKGLEISLNSEVINTSRLKWYANANFSMNRRKIIGLYGDMIDIYDDEGNIIGQKEADDVKNKWFIGQDPDRIWDYERIGVWQEEEEEEAKVYGNQPGDFKYKDQNEDGLMTDDDRVFQGYRTPRFRWSLRNEFLYKDNLSLSFLFYSNLGQYGTFNRAANNSSFPDRSSEFKQSFWTPENRINDFARIGSKNIGNNYVRKSFIRLDNITLSYSLPKSMCEKMYLQNLRVSLSIRNVAVFSSKWKYWDPENSNPTPRTFNLGVNFTL